MTSKYFLQALCIQLIIGLPQYTVLLLPIFFNGVFLDRRLFYVLPIQLFMYRCSCIYFINTIALTYTERLGRLIHIHRNIYMFSQNSKSTSNYIASDLNSDRRMNGRTTDEGTKTHCHCRFKIMMKRSAIYHLFENITIFTSKKPKPK